ncbi:transglutaminase family protein [Erythrobacter insulae]|uniref:Transglutaminase family protein n=1 Tax=Erythrobacter insulae TaxID=2584124 RepID=A0A547P9L0_9SPHN|nr:transglutaminase family protein [Erythrobacter insulae]TRD10838.1 transglutaminase family protein [Erythrobacter insulae]
MPIEITASFAFELDEPTDVLLQFEAAPIEGQVILSSKTHLSAADHTARISAQDGVGERVWVHAKGRFEARYDAAILIERNEEDLAGLPAMPPHLLSGIATNYLFDSRYCPSGHFHNFVEQEFGGTSGGDRIIAIRTWIADHLSYVAGVSGPETDASETFAVRQGICRDYAHLMITLARASMIPARYVACFSPGVSPPDFHAVAQVYLADRADHNRGTWHLIDTTGMAAPQDTVIIGVGRDAADVSFLTSFGPHLFEYSEVQVAQTT